MAQVIDPHFQVELATSNAELFEAQRLRYDVFIREMGATPKGCNQRDFDKYDALADHLILRDLNRPSDSQIIGTYRLISQATAATFGGFYSAKEFDLAPLLNSGKTILELGRSCLHPEYRGGAAMVHLWAGLSAYVVRHNIGVLFGVASFAGTNPTAHLMALSHLHHAHLAPDHLRTTSKMPNQPPLLPVDQIDRVCAMRATPALIKAYLRRGGHIGEGCFVDYSFNTTDICIILDAAAVASGAKR